MFLLTLLLVLATGYLDRLGGMVISLPLLHTVPLILSAWFGGRKIGYLFAGVSAAVLFWASSSDIPSGSSGFLVFTNALIELVVFLLVAYIVSVFRQIRDNLEELAATDPLTGLANARHFRERANLELKRARRYRHSCALMYLDLDGFKLVNDTQGHQAGDRILLAVAETLDASCRSVDLVARLGGDEFVVLLPETDKAGSEAFSGKIRQSLGNVLRDGDSPLTFSAGVITCSEPPDSVEVLIRMADAAMYRAKNQGKNTVLHDVYPTPTGSPAGSPAH